MINKILIVVLLGIALYFHNLGMFFGMIAAYIAGSMAMVDHATKKLREALDIMEGVKDLIKAIDDKKNNG